MENVLYKSIGDRSVDILRHIERYCLSENKSKLEVIRVVFDFLEGVKERLDDSFVKACLGEILCKSDENTKKAYQYENARMIRDIILNNEELAANFKNRLAAIEGGSGNVAAMLCNLLTTNKTEWEKMCMIGEMIELAKDPLYMTVLTGLYISEESGIKVEYIDHLGDTVTHIYSRMNFIQDIELVNAQYDDLTKEQKENSGKGEEEKQGSPTKEEVLLDIIRPGIAQNDRKMESIFEYLDSAKEVIHAVKNKKETTGAICLALTECEIFIEQLRFDEILSSISKYCEVDKPAYGKPGKYEAKMIDLKYKHLFIERGIN